MTQIVGVEGDLTEVTDESATIQLSDSEPTAIRLAALEQAVIFASNHYSINTKSARQIITDAAAFEGYILNGDD